jgi:hypothetical protein
MSQKSKLDVIYILSEKSSGSSYLFRCLYDALKISKYPKTHHFESETLYWTKAASVLERPQLKMLASSVPYEKDRARSELKRFLDNNLLDPIDYNSDEEMIFNGWFALIKQFGPVFIEKSPHHLLQWSALELMLEFEARFSEHINCHYVCIIRNPKDVFLSQFRRWNVSPNLLENQWLITYMNWEKFSKLSTKSLKISTVKYEDLINDTSEVVEKLCNTFNVTCDFEGKEAARSSKSCKRRSVFGYNFSSSVLFITRKFGYSDEKVQGKKSYRWWFYKTYVNYIYTPAKKIFKKLSPILK